MDTGINVWASGITAALVIWGIWLGAEAGFGHALFNLLGAFCGGILGLAALNPFIRPAMGFVLDNLYFTRFLLFWAVFFFAFGATWQIKQSVMKTKLSLPAPVDAVGGGIAGACVGLIFASAVVLTVFIPPKAESTPEWANWSGKTVLLHSERALPALYGAFAIHRTGELREDYDTDDFVELWRDPLYFTRLVHEEELEAERERLRRRH